MARDCVDTCPRERGCQFYGFARATLLTDPHGRIPNQVGERIIGRSLNIRPPITIRPGLALHALVTAAAVQGKYRVRSLVEAGADVTARDERFGATALDWAGWAKQRSVVAYLKSVATRR